MAGRMIASTFSDTGSAPADRSPILIDSLTPSGLAALRQATVAGYDEAVKDKTNALSCARDIQNVPTLRRTRLTQKLHRGGVLYEPVAQSTPTLSRLGVKRLKTPYDAQWVHRNGSRWTFKHRPEVFGGWCPNRHKWERGPEAAPSIEPEYSADQLRAEFDYWNDILAGMGMPEEPPKRKKEVVSSVASEWAEAKLSRVLSRPNLGNGPDESADTEAAEEYRRALDWLITGESEPSQHAVQKPHGSPLRFGGGNDPRSQRLNESFGISGNRDRTEWRRIERSWGAFKGYNGPLEERRYSRTLGRWEWLYRVDLCECIQAYRWEHPQSFLGFDVMSWRTIWVQRVKQNGRWEPGRTIERPLPAQETARSIFWSQRLASLNRQWEAAVKAPSVEEANSRLRVIGQRRHRGGSYITEQTANIFYDTTLENRLDRRFLTPEGDVNTYAIDVELTKYFDPGELYVQFRRDLGDTDKEILKNQRKHDAVEWTALVREAWRRDFKIGKQRQPATAVRSLDRKFASIARHFERQESAVRQQIEWWWGTVTPRLQPHPSWWAAIAPTPAVVPWPKRMLEEANDLPSVVVSWLWCEIPQPEPVADEFGIGTSGSTIISAANSGWFGKHPLNTYTVLDYAMWQRTKEEPDFKLRATSALESALSAARKRKADTRAEIVGKPSEPQTTGRARASSKSLSPAPFKPPVIWMRVPSKYLPSALTPVDPR
jgi:hypothetical protein